jgi:hypothetical protein
MDGSDERRPGGPPGRQRPITYRAATALPVTPCRLVACKVMLQVVPDRLGTLHGALWNRLPLPGSGWAPAQSSVMASDPGRPSARGARVDHEPSLCDSTAASDDLSIDKDQLSTTTEETCLSFLAVAVWRAEGDHPILAAPEIVVPEVLYSPPCPI